MQRIIEHFMLGLEFFLHVVAALAGFLLIPAAAVGLVWLLVVG